jgi:signal transduction histidine kinase
MNVEDLERAVSRRTAELERANRELDAFAREIAHELRTPIGQVAAIAELLLEKARFHSQPDLCRWLEIQLHAACSMRDMVQDLLELSRSSMTAPAFDSIDLAAMCHELRGELPVTPDRLSIDWRIQPQMRVCGGRAQVWLLMRNLLSNAIKYTRHAERPFIEVSARSAAGGGAEVIVEDNGDGFDDADAARLFQPFVRLHDAQRFQGTGLGLSLAKRIVERHGGWIRAHGRKGRGARFEFWLGDGGAACMAPPSVALHR